MLSLGSIEIDHVNDVISETVKNLAAKTCPCYIKICDIVRGVIMNLICNLMILSFWTDRSGQTVQTQIRLLLEEQSDQGFHCLLFHLHLLDKIF